MNQFKKVLLMGKAGCGKTSMRSIIFGDYVARDTARLGPTIEIDSSTANFLDDLILNILDCGGNESFMEEYFASQRDIIFSDVEILIYVFDVESSDKEVLDKEINYYKSCLEAIQQKSPEAKIFCLIHKMDLVREKEQRDVIFQAKQEDLKRLSQPLECTCFRSSIWDETLYKGWSSIMSSLVHNTRQLDDSLAQFANVIEADEVLLFERHTFLLVSHAERKKRRDPHRFEKFANIVKKFKLTCSKHVDGQIQNMEVRHSQFVAFVDEFTRNTYVLVIMSDSSLTSAAMAINIKNARKYFENY